MYLPAPPEKAQALDRFCVDMLPSSAPDPHLLGDFVVSGEHRLGELAEIYGVAGDPRQAKLSLSDYFHAHLTRPPQEGATPGVRSISLLARPPRRGRVNVSSPRPPHRRGQAQP